MLPRAWQRALAIWDCDSPAPARRARAALDLLLAGVAGDCAHSSLTPTGSAFEPAFSLAAPGLRYTVDPAPPGLDRHASLAHVLALLARLGAPAPPPSFIDRIAPLQACGALRYGAQVGGRHSALADSYKLYVEIPAEAHEQADAFGTALLASAPLLTGPGRNARPTLAGIDLASGRQELYYRIDHLHPLEIGILLSRADNAARAPEVLAMLSAAQAAPIRHALPGATWGFSYAPEAGGGITFSLYTFARTLFGPDGAIRAALLAMGARHGWNLAVYEQLSRPLAGVRRLPCHHGVVGITVPPEGPPALWIGLAPP